MSSAKEKDRVCSCEHKILLSDIKNAEFVEKLDKEVRHEIWDGDKIKCFLEYVDSENRWYFFIKSIEIEVDENGNKAINFYDIERGL